MKNDKDLTLNEKSPVTAGIIVIGDEILKGQIQDTNTFHLANELKSCGIKVQRASIISDDVNEIADEVNKFCNTFTYVFTCGGVGPTHDDVTFEAIAKAFDEELVISPEIKKVLELHFKDLNESMLKMAKVPKSAKVDYSETGSNSFPVIQLKNLFILPGVPKLLKNSFAVIRSKLHEKHAKEHLTHVSEVFLKSTEFAITDKLNHLVQKYQNSVVFGSYPSWNHNYYETKLTLESTDQSLIDQVKLEINESMDPIKYDKYPLINPMEKLEAFLSNCQDDDFVNAVKKSEEIIKDCFEKYDKNQVAIAFNGGKDCMVLLHLTQALFKHKLQALYIRDRDPFPNVEEFIEDCEKNYDLDLITIQASMKDALAKMLQDRPNVKAILMGTRMGDPGSKGQSYFSPTDGNWPSVMRVNPIIDWKYSQVWTFLRGLYLPYPKLYDQGYTSLGGKSNTSPNPHLSLANGKYKPAYELQDGSQERAGRGKKS